MEYHITSLIIKLWYKGNYGTHPGWSILHEALWSLWRGLFEHYAITLVSKLQVNRARYGFTSMRRTLGHLSYVQNSVLCSTVLRSDHRSNVIWRFQHVTDVSILAVIMFSVSLHSRRLWHIKAYLLTLIYINLHTSNHKYSVRQNGRSVGPAVYRPRAWLKQKCEYLIWRSFRSTHHNMTSPLYLCFHFVSVKAKFHIASKFAD